MSEELKPCKCGSRAIATEIWSAGNQHCTISVRCEAAGCRLVEEVRELHEGLAFPAWNGRVEEWVKS